MKSQFWVPKHDFRNYESGVTEGPTILWTCESGNTSTEGPTILRTCESGNTGNWTILRTCDSGNTGYLSQPNQLLESTSTLRLHMAMSHVTYVSNRYAGLLEQNYFSSRWCTFGIVQPGAVRQGQRWDNKRRYENCRSLVPVFENGCFALIAAGPFPWQNWEPISPKQM